jgi:tetratricopeptide (TPR) repeat protein
VAIDLNNLGIVLRALGNLAGARRNYEQALKIDEAFYGLDHPSVAIDVNNLGRVLHDLGDLARAQVNFERALKIFKNVFGNDHPRTKRVQENIDSLTKLENEQKNTG